VTEAMLGPPVFVIVSALLKKDGIAAAQRARWAKVKAAKKTS
jgi:hypothetical protein